MALGLAALGTHVILVARTLPQARDRAAEIGPLAVAGAADLTDPTAIAALAERITSAHGWLDILINTAAVTSPWGEKAANADLALALVQTLMEANLYALSRRPSFRFCAKVQPGVLSTFPTRGQPWRSGLWPGLEQSDGHRLCGVKGRAERPERETGAGGILPKPARQCRLPRLCRDGGLSADSAMGVIWAATLPDTGPSSASSGTGIAWAGEERQPTCIRAPIRLAPWPTSRRRTWTGSTHSRPNT